MMSTIWQPSADRIIAVRSNGIGDMGDLSDEQSPARFSLDKIELGGRMRDVLLWSLLACRVRFTGGAGSAELSLCLDHRDDSGLFDWKLHSWSGAGTGGKADIVHRISREDELYALYLFWAGDQIVFTWTNPDAGNMRWMIELLLAAQRVTGE